MSGVCGANRINRVDVMSVLERYEKNVLQYIDGYKGYCLSGSFNSNLDKTDFGDIDLIVYISNDNKKAVKELICNRVNILSDEIIVPFSNPKYKGRKYYNSGEIITVNYPQPNGTVQIDNIIAINEQEMDFKRNFLDLPAEKQGLILGLVKTAIQDEFIHIDNRRYPTIDPDEVFEFNLSSVELQLRAVKEIEVDGEIKQSEKRVIWRTTDWGVVLNVLQEFDISNSFEDLLVQVKHKVTNERSLNRIIGIFKSMISVKSGEVGTDKALSKDNAIRQIEHLINT